MTHTVIGIFDNKSEAQHAVDQLVSSGLMRDNIDVSSQNTPSDSMNSSADNKFGNFFGSLLDKEDDVRNYSQAANKGCVVTVHAQSEQEAQMASDVLDRAGAVDVDERAMQYQKGTSNSATENTTGQALPVIEEELHVGKREVRTGGVRLRSRVIERPVEEHLRLREEHVHVDRNPVNRATTSADFENFKEGVIELREQAEVPVVSKEARIVEEVSLTKEVTEREEVVKDTLRKTDVEVENFKGNAETGVSGSQNLTGSHTDTDADYLDKSHKGWQGALRRMKELEDDYKVAEDDEDVRGWDVVDSTGDKIGEVDELIVDTQAMKVRYLDVDVDSSLVDADDHHILLPIGSATIDRSNKNVMVSTLNSSSLANYPAYQGETISRDYENQLLTALSPGYNSGNVTNDRFYEGEHFDSGKFYGSRKL